ncbi:MAG: ferritin-like domain-containing protein [Alphaproteobacteria bacterium]|nr:ferritin-like domain-containing protein [Alphaproteobacteria bacterium]
MTAHWTLDSIPWHSFDASKVDPELLKAVKAAAMVEYNAADYVGYLKAVFAGDAKAFAAFDQWGIEEVQHGAALARWAEMADPSFKFEPAFAKFREGYRPPHFDTGEAARGSRRGEMIARCVVESGTSSYYTAIKDACDEPVLKEIAAKIAADEYRHYKLFYEMLDEQPERLSFLKRLQVAATRVNEAEDDELAYAYYCGNTPLDQIGVAPYDRKACVTAYQTRVTRLYRQRHIEQAMRMIAKSIGAAPNGLLRRFATWAVWTYLRFQTRGAAA